MADALRICHCCLHPTIYHSHDTRVQEQSTYNHKKLRQCLKSGINLLSQLYSLEIQKWYKPMYLDVHAQFWAVEQSCFPRLWFPAVERHYFKQRTYLSFPWVHLRFPFTLFSFYSTFRLCGTGEPWHANKTSLLSLTGTFRAVFSHKFLSSSVWQQQLCTSGFWALSRCLYSSVLYPKLCRSWGWEVHLNAPIMSQLRSLSRQKSGSGSRIFAAAHNHCMPPRQLLLGEAESPQRSDYRSTWRKALCFPTPFVHTAQQ